MSNSSRVSVSSIQNVVVFLDVVLTAAASPTPPSSLLAVADHHMAPMCRYRLCRALVVQLIFTALLHPGFLSSGNSDEEGSEYVAGSPKVEVSEVEGGERQACRVEDLLPVELEPGDLGGWVEDASERTTAYDCSCPFYKAR